MTQEALAEILFTKKSTISEYENDKIDLKYSVLKEIAKALDTSVRYLSGEQDEEIADALSDLTGFCVEGFYYTIENNK